MTLRIGNDRLQVSGCRFQVMGFSLVEMLIVLAIIAMLLGVSLPFTAGFGRTLRIKTTSQAIISTLRLAKSNAAAYRENFSVNFNLEENMYWIEDEKGILCKKRYELPSSIKFDQVTFSGKKITFTPNGILGRERGTIVISDKRKNKREITVAGTTGKITVEKR